MVPLLTSFTGSEKKQKKTKEKLKSFFLMSDEAADRFRQCFAKFKPESIEEGKAEGMQFKDEMFDGVSCHMSIHHHPHPEKSLV